MKKLGIVMIVILAIFWSAFAFGQVQWQVLSPITVVREKGKPVKKTFPFTALGGTATITVHTNGLVTSTTVTLDKVLWKPGDFKKRIITYEKQVEIKNGLQVLEIYMEGKPGAQLTVGISQDVPEVNPQMGRLQIANALIVGNLESASQGFKSGKKVDIVFPILADDPSGREEMAKWIQEAVLIEEDEDSKTYRYVWIDGDGIENFVEFTMAKNDQGEWIIINW